MLAGCAAITGVASLVVVVSVEVNPAPPPSTEVVSVVDVVSTIADVVATTSSPSTEVVSVVDVVSTIADVVKVFLSCNFVISSTLG